MPQALLTIMFFVKEHYIGPTDGTFWMPPAASSGAHEVDWLIRLLLYVCMFFFALIVSLLVTFVVTYRRGRVGGPQPSAAHSLPLELAWTAIPLAILITIFFFGFRGFVNLMTPVEDAYEIQVTGQKWAWLFTYPSGYVDKDLHVPVDTPVSLTLTSNDVIHSLFVPAFRLKRDAVPGRYTRTWFAADRVGKFDLFCAEYCGEGHSRMHAYVIVQPKEEYRKCLEPHGFKTQRYDENVVHNMQSVVFKTPENINRDKLIEHMKKNGIEATIGTYCLSGTTYYRGKYNQVLDNASFLERTTLTLPCFEGVNVERVCAAIIKC